MGETHHVLASSTPAWWIARTLRKRYAAYDIEVITAGLLFERPTDDVMADKHWLQINQFNQSAIGAKILENRHTYSDKLTRQVAPVVNAIVARCKGAIAAGAER